MREPFRLRRGKVSQKKIQTDWLNEAKGDVRIERGVTKPSGRKGRVDVLVDQNQSMVAMVEVKASDWDAMTESAVCRNVRRQIRQIWDYIGSQLAEGKEVCPGVILPKRPTKKERMDLIESLFNEEGIQVVWDDETLDECRTRLNQSR